MKSDRVAVYLLGAGFARLRPPLPEFTLLGGMMVNRLDIPHLRKIGRSVRSTLRVGRLVLEYALQRLRSPRGRDRAIDVLRTRHRHPTDRVLGIGVDHIGTRSTDGSDPASVDVVPLADDERARVRRCDGHQAARGRARIENVRAARLNEIRVAAP